MELNPTQTNNIIPFSTAAATQMSEGDRYVSAPKLLELLFPKESRPTVRWLREQQKRRRIPYKKIGRKVYFRPNEVQEAIERNFTITAKYPM